MKKILGIVVAVIVLVFAAWIWARYFYVFSEGYEAGTLNYVVKKGYIFKTYEGELILTGFKTRGQNMMGSNEFLFSIADPTLAQKLMLNSGKEMQLHYKEYKGALPWRGYSNAIVDSVVAIENPPGLSVPFR